MNWRARLQINLVGGIDRWLAARRDRLWAALRGYRFHDRCVEFGGLAGRVHTPIGAPPHAFSVGPVTFRSPHVAVVTEALGRWGLKFEDPLDAFVDVGSTQRITVEVSLNGGQGLGIRSLRRDGSEIVRKRVDTVDRITPMTFDPVELDGPIAHLEFFADDTLDNGFVYSLCRE